MELAIEISDIKLFFKLYERGGKKACKGEREGERERGREGGREGGREVCVTSFMQHYQWMTSALLLCTRTAMNIPLLCHAMMHHVHGAQACPMM